METDPAALYTLALLGATALVWIAACAACHWFMDRRATRAYGPFDARSRRS